MRLKKVTYHNVEIDDMNLAGLISNTLEKHYSGWGWLVRVDSEGGIVEIINGIMNATLTKQYGYVLKLAKLNNTYDMIVKQSVNAGGELLERMGVPRGPWRGDGGGKVEGVKASHQPLKGDGGLFVGT